MSFLYGLVNHPNSVYYGVTHTIHTNRIIVTVTNVNILIYCHVEDRRSKKKKSGDVRREAVSREQASTHL